MLFLAIFLVLEMLKFWSVNYVRSVNYTFILNMSEILDNIYIWVFPIKSKSVLLLVLVEYMLYRYFTQNCTFCTFWMLKILVLRRKNVENLLRFMYLFCPKNGAFDYTETFITQEWLVVEGCPNPRWITFVILYRLVYNIRPHLN